MVRSINSGRSASEAPLFNAMPQPESSQQQQQPQQQQQHQPQQEEQTQQKSSATADVDHLNWPIPEDASWQNGKIPGPAVKQISSSGTVITQPTSTPSGSGRQPTYTRSGTGNQDSSVSGVKTSVTRASSIAVINAQSSFLLTFEREPKLFRGVPLSVVLRNCGAIWKHSGGTTKTYALSRPVTKLRTFISHNWSVGRFRKWVALCLYFNHTLASVCVLIVAALLCMLHIAGVIPVMDDYVTGPDEDHPLPTGFAVRMASGIAFLLLLFFGRNVVAPIGILGPDVFLDKVCIHQTDVAVQKRGIAKLGAFLRYSDEMLVLYTNQYLLKLWTIYEVAAFLLLHPVKKMKVVPVNLAVLYCVAVFVGSLGPAGIALCRMAQLSDTLGLALTHVAAYFYVYFLREWHRDKQLMKERLSNFTVHDALCSVESDRPLVLDNIVAMMKAHQKVDYEASRSESLAAFDKLVRTELPEAFSSAVGQYMSFSYGQIILMSFVASWSMCFDALGGLGEASEAQVRQIMAGFCNYLVWGLVVYPFFWVLREYIASFFLHWRGWKDIAWVCFAQLLTAAIGFPFLSLINKIRDKAYESNAALAFIVAYTITASTFGSYGLSLLFSVGNKSFRKASDRSESDALPNAGVEQQFLDPTAVVAQKISEASASDETEALSDEGFPIEDFAF